MSTPADWFDDQVRRDDEMVDNIAAGAPATERVGQLLGAFRDDVNEHPLPHVSGWIEDPREPSGWRWIENLAAMPAGTPHQVGPSQPYPTPQWAPGPYAPGLVDVPERIDGWCENRDPRELTNEDGVD